MTINILGYAIRGAQWLIQRRKWQRQELVMNHFRERQAGSVGPCIIAPALGHPVQAICEELVAKGRLTRAAIGGYCLPGRGI